MKINIFHWKHLRVSTTSSTSFHSKNRTQEGSRKTTTAFFPILFNPSVRPIETVVFPSPAGVGLIAETKIKFEAATFFSSIN